MIRERDWSGWLITLLLISAVMLGGLELSLGGSALAGGLICLAVAAASLRGAAGNLGRWPSLRHPAIIAAAIALLQMVLGQGNFRGALFYLTLAIVTALPSLEGSPALESETQDESPTGKRAAQALALPLFLLLTAAVGEFRLQDALLLTAAFLPLALGQLLSLGRGKEKFTRTIPWIILTILLLAAALWSRDRLVMVTVTAVMAMMAWIHRHWLPALAALLLLGGALTAQEPAHLEALLFQTDVVSASFPSGTGAGRFKAGLLEILPAVQPWSQQKGLDSTIQNGPGFPGLILVEQGWMGSLVLLAMLAYCANLLSRAFSSNSPEETGASLATLSLIPMLVSSGMTGRLFFPLAVGIALLGRCLIQSAPGSRGAARAGVLICLLLIAGWAGQGIQQARSWDTISRARELFQAKILEKGTAPDGPEPEKTMKTVHLSAYPAQGCILYFSGDNPGALAKFKAADPSDFTFQDLIVAGRAYMADRDMQQAFSAFHSAFLLSGRQWLPGLELTGLYKTIGQPRAALDILETISESHERQREILSEKGSLCEALGQGARAQTIFEAAHTVTGDPSFLARAGQTALRMKDYALAMDYFRRAAEEGDRISTLRYIEAAVLSEEHEKAMAFIKERAGSIPSSGKELKRLQMILGGEKCEPIREALSKAIAANTPSLINKLKERVSELERIGRLEAALGEIDHFLSTGGEDGPLRLRRGDLLLKMSRNLEAADAYLEAARKTRLKDSGMSLLYRKVAQAFARARKYRTAIYYSEKALSYAGGRDPELLNDLAKTYGLADMHREAEETLLKALNINPDLQVTYYNLAMAYYKRNLYKKAIEVVNVCLAKIPVGIFTDRLKALKDHLETFKVLKTDKEELKNLSEGAGALKGLPGEAQ